MYTLLCQCIFVLFESWSLVTPVVESFSLKVFTATLSAWIVSYINDDSSPLCDDGNGRASQETQFKNVSISTVSKKFCTQWIPYIPMHCTSFCPYSMIVCPFLKKKKKSKIMGTVNTKFNLIPIKLVKGENKNEDVQGFCLHIWWNNINKYSREFLPDPVGTNYIGGFRIVSWNCFVDS